MNKRLLIINIIFAIGDTIISGLAILAFAFCSYTFGKWWIILFTIIPVVLYNSHSLIIDEDLRSAKADELYERGEDDAR